MSVTSKLAARSLRSLGREAGISASYISLVFAGKREPRLAIAARIAACLGVTLDDLYRHLKPKKCIRAE